MSILFKIIGAIGLMFVSAGMLVKNRQTRDVLCAIGAMGLLAYSVFLKDIIFIVLQSMYILITLIDRARYNKK